MPAERPANRIHRTAAALRCDVQGTEGAQEAEPKRHGSAVHLDQPQVRPQVRRRSANGRFGTAVELHDALAAILSSKERSQQVPLPEKVGDLIGICLPDRIT